jgi:hypothetical protein
MTKDEWYAQLFERLGNSKFRSSFHLKQKDIDYINEKGMDTIRDHAKDFIAKREAPAVIPNDGKQTPTKGAIVRWTMFSTDRVGGETIRYLLHNMQPQLAVGSASVSGTNFSRGENLVRCSRIISSM